jgi:hypothetical protein
MSHGISELFHLADWLDLHDQTLMASVEAYLLQAAFLWDVTLTGAQDKDIEAAQKGSAIPRPGSVRYHSEKMKWEAVSPNISAPNAQEFSRLLKNFVLAGAGFPEHWFAEGGNVNRATALAMGEPTLKRLKSFQRKVKAMFTAMLTYVRDTAIQEGTISKSADSGFEVILPAITVDDIESVAKVMPPLTLALQSALDAGWVKDEDVNAIMRVIFSRIGYEFKREEKQGTKESLKESWERYDREFRRTVSHAPVV